MLGSVGECIHQSTNLKLCTTYALITSSMFVLNLYLLLPKSVQKLSRDNPIQIKWRIFSVFVTIILSIAIYPFLFCDDEESTTSGSSTKSLGMTLGLTEWRLSKSLLPLCHAIVLYFGAICTSVFQHRTLYLLRTKGTKGGLAHYIQIFVNDTFKRKIVDPFTANRWGIVRDLVIAPASEELIFRSCIITPFLHLESFQNGTLSLTKVSWCTPLFFGIAHLHHAFKRLRQRDANKKSIILSSMFQFLFTTVFGAYASFCFIKTGSVLGVILLHSFCNFMGLPSLHFFFNFDSKLLSELKYYKIICSLAYVVGIVCFWIGLYSSKWGVL